MPETARLLASLLKRGEELPRHIAIIMDGSGRWASKRGLPRLAGHREGRKSVRAVVQAALDLKHVEVLTLFTFSTENWQRPKAEVEGLMKFLCRVLAEERGELRDQGVRMSMVGDLSALPVSVRRAFLETEKFLEGGEQLQLVLALSYGGRQELVHAARELARAVQCGELEPDAIQESHLAARLWTAGLPDPDLLIRTSGEMRVSNFLLWQIAYAEIYVTETLWPDFRGLQLFEAAQAYLGRERRFGGVQAVRRGRRRNR